MISRDRSISNAVAMSIERTMSANSTVTCLYSAGAPGTAIGDPHSLQNFAFGGSSVPQATHANPAAVMRTPPIRCPIPDPPRIRRLAADNTVIDAMYSSSNGSVRRDRVVESVHVALSS
jgi:hypothetical protein